MVFGWLDRQRTRSVLATAITSFVLFGPLWRGCQTSFVLPIKADTFPVFPSVIRVLHFEVFHRGFKAPARHLRVRVFAVAVRRCRASDFDVAVFALDALQLVY